ncbi:hypothetical protein CEXT_80561 [Caerostris extrusa]|uniref:Uncharacterized protein n=1 Tax=Caerostris extrusa TaxID=172846 RepID=A0AAV4TJQ3_CAEEX|nr:hypothetical protein CEXT_80561 [Caerostris extrusa]
MDAKTTHPQELNSIMSLDAFSLLTEYLCRKKLFSDTLIVSRDIKASRDKAIKSVESTPSRLLLVLRSSSSNTLFLRYYLQECNKNGPSDAIKWTERLRYAGRVQGPIKLGKLNCIVN